MAASHESRAGGFYISEVGTPGSLGTAGVANPTNTFSADAAFTNPAGLIALQPDEEILTGAQAVVPNMQFDPDRAEAGGDNGGNAGVYSAIPSFFYARRLSDRWSAGFSATAPLGGGMEYGDGFVGRYGASKATLAGLALSPSLAFKVDERLSIGAGVSFLYTRFDQNIAILQPGFQDGKAKMDDLDDWSWQGFVGVTYALSDELLLGAVYRSESDVDVDGDLKLRNLRIPFSPADEVELSWDNPQTAEVGLRYQLRDDVFLFTRAAWEDWSEFSQNQLTISGGAVSSVSTIDRNWKDTWSLGAALAYQTSQGEILSAGVAYDSSVVDDEDRTIDLPLDQSLQLSAAYAREGDGRWSYALGATLYLFGDGEVDQTTQGVRFSGEFRRNYMMFLGGTLRYLF